MAAETRSVNNELHVGCREGSCNYPRKDWGGPLEARSRPPMPVPNESGWLDVPGDEQ